MVGSLDTLTMGEAPRDLQWDNISQGGQVAHLMGYLHGIAWYRSTVYLEKTGPLRSTMEDSDLN